MRGGQPFSPVKSLRGAHRLIACVVACSAAFAAACGGSTVVSSVTGPDAVRCQTSASAPPTTIPADGGRVTVTVDAPRDCTWTASSDASWVQLGSTSGQGAATIAATVAANDRGAARTGAIAINDQRVTLSQEGRPCTFDFSVAPPHMSSGGGRGSIGISTLEGCAWTAASSAAWLRVLAGSGEGPGVVEFEALPNSGSAREASITVAGRSITIGQDGATPAPNEPDCAATLTPSALSAPAAGGSLSFSVGVGAACDWRAATTASWITIAPPAGGRGAGTVNLTVARNSGSERSGGVTVNGQAATVTQEAAPVCTVGISPSSRNFPASGGQGTIAVTTPAGCEWSASGGQSWASITNGRGTGNGEARYAVAQNTSTASRSTTITIGGQRHSVTQDAAACTFSIDASSRNFGAAGGEGRVRVTTQSGCAWSVSGAPSWISVGTGQGTGAGDAAYTVQANTGSASRSATLTIAGRSHAVTQEGVPTPTCTYSLQPATASFGAGGGNGSFNVMTQAGCGWSASSGAGWASVSNGSGSGPAQVNYTVAANGDANARSATITVNGQTHSISQAAAAPTCTYSLQPSSASYGAGGGNGSFDVVTQAGCSWSASGSPVWVSVSNGSGSGPGQVNYTVAANGDANARSASITVNGQTHSISQAAAAPTCTYSLQPSSASYGAGGGNGSFNVVTQAGCSWSASSGAGWAAVSNGSGSGSGQVSYAVAANTGTSPRATAITVNGQTHGITQAAAAPTCTYAVQPSSASFGAGGGSGQFDVVTQGGCAWSVSGGAGWITVSTPSGSGPAQVSYTVASNSDTNGRSASLSVNGQTHSISQAAAAPPAPPPCSYSVELGTRRFGEEGGSGTARVTTGTGCAWTASSSASWVSVSPGSGTGSGEVRYTVERNTSDDERRATLTIAGQSFTIEQAQGSDDDDDDDDDGED